jgi:hypothetical protein
VGRQGIVLSPARAQNAEYGDGRGAEAVCSGGARSRGAVLTQSGRRELEHRWISQEYHLAEVAGCAE